MIIAYKIFQKMIKGVVHLVDLSTDGGYKLRKVDRDIDCESLDLNQLT